MFAAERHGALHGCMGIQVARAGAAIPAFQRAELRDWYGLRARVHAAVAHHGRETREAVDAVGVHAIAGGLGKEAGTQVRAVRCKSKAEQGRRERSLHVIKGNPLHQSIWSQHALRDAVWRMSSFGGRFAQ